MKQPRRKKKELSEGVVTNATLDEHREVLLERGKKFKYQVQYEKHKLIINTIIIVVLLLASAVTLGWYSLYVARLETPAAFLLAQVAPVPVAKIDGQQVRYSDYLAQYLASVNVVERQEGAIPRDEDGERQRAYYRRGAMDNAITDAYARKLAREQQIKVSRQEINDALNSRRMIGETEVTEQDFARIIEESYGLNLSEYTRAFVELPLYRQKVAEAIDEEARSRVNELRANLADDGSNSETIAQQAAESELATVEQSSGAVELMSLDGGRAMAASVLEVGQVSAPFVSKAGTGYYIVKTTNKLRDGRVEYLSLFVPFNELKTRVETLKTEGKVKEYIQL